MRNDTLTVADMIRILSTMDPNMPVHMGMNMEYSSPVSADMLEVDAFDGVTMLYINDCPGA